MLILREPIDLPKVTDQSIRDLITHRFNELRSDDYDWSELGYFVVVQAGDTINDLENCLQIQMTTAVSGSADAGQPGFIPRFELLEEHANCFEIVYVLDDSGYGVTLLVPKLPESPLTAFCRHYKPANQNP